MHQKMALQCDAWYMIKMLSKAIPLFSTDHRLFHIQCNEDRYQNEKLRSKMHSRASGRTPIFRDPRNLLPLHCDCPASVGQIINY
jgi:hypothetical protein